MAARKLFSRTVRTKLCTHIACCQFANRIGFTHFDLSTCVRAFGGIPVEEHTIVAKHDVQYPFFCPFLPRLIFDYWARAVDENIIFCGTFIILIRNQKNDKNRYAQNKYIQSK